MSSDTNARTANSVLEGAGLVKDGGTGTGTVKEMFETLPKDCFVVAMVKCGAKTERFMLKKTDKRPITVNDNDMTFDNTKFELNLSATSSFIRIKRPKLPIELTLHTEHGRAYVSSEDGITYKSHTYGDLKIVKALKGDVDMKTTNSSSACNIL